jgi:hypothetical protein
VVRVAAVGNSHVGGVSMAQKAHDTGGPVEGARGERGDMVEAHDIPTESFSTCCFSVRYRGPLGCT